MYSGICSNTNNILFSIFHTKIIYNFMYKPYDLCRIPLHGCLFVFYPWCQQYWVCLLFNSNFICYFRNHLMEIDIWQNGYSWLENLMSLTYVRNSVHKIDLTIIILLILCYFPILYQIWVFNEDVMKHAIESLAEITENRSHYVVTQSPLGQKVSIFKILL